MIARGPWTRGGVLAALLCAGAAHGSPVVVTGFAPAPGDGVWGIVNLNGGATAGVADLTGLGGDLETNPPLPTGAAVLTTQPGTPGNPNPPQNLDRATVGIGLSLGKAVDVLPSLQIGLDTFKTLTDPALPGDDFAGLTIELTVENAATGDAGRFQYIPSLNQPGGGSQPVPAEAWQSVAIDADTGGDGLGDGVQPASSSGGWRWLGGFGLGNSATRTFSLNEWLGLFTNPPAFNPWLGFDDAAFAGAEVTSLSLGVGFFDLNQTLYFDRVSILAGQTTDLPDGFDTTYDFEATVAVVPLPAGVWAGLALFGMLGGVKVVRRRQHAE